MSPPYREHCARLWLRFDQRWRGRRFYDVGMNETQPAFGDFGDRAPVAQGATQLSGLALASLVLGGMSVVGCLIPAFGLVPIVFGIAALFAVSRAQGRLAGRGLALGGIMMGGFSLVISTGLWYGGTSILHSMGRTYANVFDADPANVRTVLTTSLAGSISDEQIEAFEQAVKREHGGFVSMPRGLLDVITLSRSAQGSDRIESAKQQVAGTILPMPVKMGKGTRIVLFVLDPNEILGTSMPAVADVGIFTADESHVIWLVGNQPPAGGSGIPNGAQGVHEGDASKDDGGSKSGGEDGESGDQSPSSDVPPADG